MMRPYAVPLLAALALVIGPGIPAVDAAPIEYHEFTDGDLAMIPTRGETRFHEYIVPRPDTVSPVYCPEDQRQ